MKIILLPGMDGTGELFGPLLDSMPANPSVIVVRYPDCPANYAGHEAVARAELPKDAPFVLLGESFSGPVAVSIAAAAPPNLRGVILSASFLTSPHPLLRPLRALTPFVSPKLVPDVIAHRTLLGRFATPALRAAHRRALGHVSSATLTARLRAMADVDVRDAMKSVRRPALYLRGTEDRVVGARFGDEVLAHARHGTLVDIEGPHLLLQANPRDSARRIATFIATLDQEPQVPAP